MFSNVAKWNTPQPIRTLLYRGITNPQKIRDSIEKHLQEHLIPYMQFKETFAQGYKNIGVANVCGDLMGMLFATVDSTASTTTMVLYQLSQHPDIFNELKQQLQEIGSEDPNQIKQVKLLDWVIKESLLHHPPNPVIFRGVKKAFNHFGLQFKPGDLIMFPIQAMHLAQRNLGDSGEDFNPWRWQQQDTRPKHFLAFGYGKQRCTGEGMAIQNVKLQVAYVVSNYNITCEQETIQWDLNQGGVPKSREPIQMQFTPSNLAEEKKELFQFS